MEETKRASKEKTIFIDADAFIAFMKEDDTNHERAKHIFEAIENREALYLTSNYVISEVITVLSQRVHHQAAVDYIETIYSPTNSITIKRVNEEIEQMAIDIFKQQTSKNVSFVDCTNMAVVNTYELDYIFSFDEAYSKNGYSLVEAFAYELHTFQTHTGKP
jgi:predicted nucleic acid-binding protein